MGSRNRGVWFVVDKPSPSIQKLPKWMSCVYRRQDGKIFVPSILCGGDHEAYSRIGYDDSEKIMCDDGHYYVEAEHMKTTFPVATEVVNNIVRSIRALVN